MNGKFLKFIKNWKYQGSNVERLKQYTKPHMKSLILLVILNILSSAVGIGMTLINRHIIDSATQGRPFMNSIVIYVGVILSTLVVSIASGILGTVINERFAFGIRLKIYDCVMKSCWDKVSAYHSGDIITRLTSDIDIVASGISEIIPSIISLSISLIGAFITLAYFDTGIALFALILGPITALIGLISGRLMNPLQVKIQESESAYKSYMQESISNFAVFKAFDAQKDAVKHLENLREERLHWIMQRQKVSSITAGFLNLSFQFGYIVAFVYSVIRMSNNFISFGTMSVFISLVSQIQSPVVGLSRLIPRTVSIFASTGRIIEIEDLPTEETNFPDLGSGAVGLDLLDLCFSYGDEMILKNATARIEPGEFVALMGSSGIGKTTLIRLVMAYLIPDSGSIDLFHETTGKRGRINAGARKYLSYVPQGNTLISGRIIDNIRMSRSDISEDEIWKIFSVVMVEDFVRSTPNGLYTVIGERGLGLSEGQAQRLAIARAIAKGAGFLILDEATSALDESTEMSVLQHLRQNAKGLTCLLITHRRTVLQYCDRCIRIEDKRIKETNISHGILNETE